MLPTKERLARALEAEGVPVSIVAQARQGYYDDYESEIATPQMTLVADLQAHGFMLLAKRAMDGEWDGTKAEAEAWYEREGKYLLGAKR